VPFIENIIYCVATYPDGSPAAGAKITFKTGKAGNKFSVEKTATTNAGGIAQVRITPKKEWFQNRGYDYSKRDRFGRPRMIIVMDAFVGIVDDKGSKAARNLMLSSKPLGEDIILRLDKAVYAAGDTLSADVLTTAEKGLVYIDITRGRQTVLTKTVEIASGKGHLDFNVTADIFGSLEVHAYRVTPSGQMMRDTRVIYVHPARNLDIKIDSPKTTFLPGEENVAIDFFVTGKDGQPTQSALGIIIVDESVYALQDMQPGLEKIYFTLEAELAKPQVEICNHPFVPEQFVRERELKEAKQDAAKVMFASAEPVTEFSWNRNPATERTAKYRQNLNAIWNALAQNVGNLKEFIEKNEATKKWGFRKDALQMLVKKNYIKEEQIKEPLDRTMFITLSSLEKFSDSFAFDKWLAIDTSQKKQNLWQAVWRCVLTVDLVEGKAGVYSFRKGALEKLVKVGGLVEKQLATATGEKLTLEKLAASDKAFTPANVALATASRRKKFIWVKLHSKIINCKPNEIISFDNESKAWIYNKDAIEKLVLEKAQMYSPDGIKYDLNKLGKANKAFSSLNFFRYYHSMRINNICHVLTGFIMPNNTPTTYGLGGGRTLQPEEMIDEMIRRKILDENVAKDACGKRMKIIVPPSPTGMDHRRLGEFMAKVTRYVIRRGSLSMPGCKNFMQIVSAGPDGKFGTADDWKESGSRTGKAQHRQAAGGSRTGYTQYNQEPGLVHYRPNELYNMRNYGRHGRMGDKDGFGLMEEAEETGAFADAPRGIGRGQANGIAKKPGLTLAAPMKRREKKETERVMGKGGGSYGRRAAGIVPKPVRIREYFPETLLFEPSLITDEGGRARLVIPQLADSITTFRMTASAIAKSGALGGTTGSIRIFQDFFVDIDLPVMLTRGDEVSIPVAAYNYLQTDQDVRITMEKDEWFELLSEQSQTLSLKPGEVTATYFRIRAKKVGFQKLLVKAEGSKMSDAMRRVIEVAPDGKKFEFVDNGRLTGDIETQVVIPPDSIPDSYKILVKVYPGIYSQVTEGMEAMLCLPGG
jgi:hypothetical protein